MKAVLLAVIILPGCHTPPPVAVRPVEPVVITKSLRVFSNDLRERWLYQRYLAPTPTQTLYDGPNVIVSKVPRP